MFSQKEPPSYFSQTTPKDINVGSSALAKKIQSVNWNCSGHRLAAGSSDSEARLFSLDQQTGQLRQLSTLSGHTDQVDSVEWDPTNEERLATASSDHTVRVWDAKSGQSILKLQTEGENINAAWSPDGQTLVVGDENNNVLVFDMRKPKKPKKVKFTYEVNEFKWAPNSEYVLFATGTGNAGNIELMRYRRDKGNLEKMFGQAAHHANCYSLDIDPTHRFLAVGGADHLVTIWDLQDLICLRTISRLQAAAHRVRFSGDGRFLASSPEITPGKKNEHAKIDICHTETGELAISLDKGAASSMAWHPKSLLLAVAHTEEVMGVDNNPYKNRSLRLWSFREHDNNPVPQPEVVQRR